MIIEFTKKQSEEQTESGVIMKSSVCYKYVRVAFLPIVNTSTQPEVIRQIGIRFIICVVAMWLQALDKTLSMRRDKLSA